MKDNKNYIKVYFRIDNDYNGMSGWISEESNKEFRDQCKELFTELGFEVVEDNRNGYCNTIYKGFNNLYLHPQSLSGILEVNDDLQDINTIEQCDFIKSIRDKILLKNYSQIKLKRVEFGIKKEFTKEDIVKNYTKEELLKVLGDRSKELEEEILLKSTTKRSNLYKQNSYNLYQYNKYSSLKGINFDKYEWKKNRKDKLENVANGFMQDFINKLVASGKVKITDDGNYIQNIHNVKHYRELLKEQPKKTIMDLFG